ncbi:MAG: hypothetical protein U9Q06_03150 [Nanoarchaeota archaeon]|nr:hypothetical protein [Nanoarchaeota archaeon]
MVQGYDIFGNIAMLKFGFEIKKAEKLRVAKKIMKENKPITTVLEKVDKIKGRLRKLKTEHLVGIKTKVAEYKENNCRFVFDVDETYFSPRLSNERKEVAELIKKNKKVLVMFGGVGPFAIVIGKNSSPKLVISNEINRRASKYAERNVILNKLQEVVKIVQGNSWNVAEDFAKTKVKFDYVVMPRPQLKDTFLDSAFKVVKKKGIVIYYGFGKDHKIILGEIIEQAKIARKKIKILKVKRAGDIAPYKYRWRVDLRVL